MAWVHAWQTLGLWLLVLALCSLTLAWSLVPAWLLASGVLCSLCMNLACSDYRKSENPDWQALHAAGPGQLLEAPGNPGRLLQAFTWSVLASHMALALSWTHARMLSFAAGHALLLRLARRPVVHREPRTRNQEPMTCDGRARQAFEVTWTTKWRLLPTPYI